MIEILQVEESKKYEVFRDGNKINELNLINSSVTNKFYIITNFINKLSKHSSDFDEWLETFLITFDEGEERRFEIMEHNVPIIQGFVDRYFDDLEIDYSAFVDESKAKKSSILFKEDEIKRILRLSNYLKVYSLISNVERFKLPKRSHKNIYNMISMDIISSDIVLKIFNVIKTKTFRYNISDRAMWDYIKMIQSKDIDTYVIEIFNFIMNQILVMCEEDRNPITYFVSVIDESVKWVLRSVYKGTIVYEDSISTEDVTGPNVDNLKSYSYNDTLGLFKTIAYDHIFGIIEKDSTMKFDIKTDEEITRLQNRLSEIQYVSPVCEFLTFPILSKLTSVPYFHFSTISAEHAAVLSFYLSLVLKRVFKGKYNDLFSLLDHYPTTEPAIATTYKIKQYKKYIKTQNVEKNFFGFSTKITAYKSLNYFIGRISRINLCGIIDGKKLAGIPMSKIESDAIEFYTKFWAGAFDTELAQMKKIVDSNF